MLAATISFQGPRLRAASGAFIADDDAVMARPRQIHDWDPRSHLGDAAGLIACCFLWNGNGIRSWSSDHEHCATPH
jgi:hypothetical protein